MKRKITILFFFLFLPAFVLAGTVGKIQGKVTDLQTGEPLIGANVLVVGTSFGAATDVNGVFTINSLDPGVYTLRSSYLGYKTVTISNVRVNVDLTSEVDFKLPAEGISVGEVNIVAKRPLINKSNTNAIRNTTSENIEALPVRGVTNIIGLTPGVVLQDNTIYVRGGRQDEVGYFLEGTNITNPVFGGRTVTIVQDAVEEISVQAGGFTAEFGGANAGIIRTQLKSGTSKFKATIEYVTDNLSFRSKANRFNGEKTFNTYGYGYNEFIGTVSGPVISEKVKFFGLFDYNYSLDSNPGFFPGINLGVITDPLSTTPETNSIDLTYPAGPTLKHSRESYTGTGTLTLDLNPVIIRLTGTWTNIESYGGNSGKISSLLDMYRRGVTKGDNGAFSLKVTHILNPTTFYEISAGYSLSKSTSMDPSLGDNWRVYGDSVANANAGYVWNRTARDIKTGRVGRYQRPTPYDILGFRFAAPNDIIAGYAKSKNEDFTFNGSFSTEINKQHSIKIGGELQLFKIRRYGVAASTVGERFNTNSKSKNPKTEKEVMIGLGTNAYGYDLFGNEFNGGGILGAKKPVIAGAYIQDQISYKNIIINVGLRYDYIDIDNYAFVDQSRPELTINKNNGSVDVNGLVKTPTFSSLSPRLGFSFPVTDRTVFHAQFGKFVQQSRLRDVYQGLYATSAQLRGGFFIGAPVGFNVRPTRTTQYEIGFTQQLSDFASFDITGYYKDIQDQVVFQLQNTVSGSPFGSYNILTNGDFATTKGVELSFNMRRVERIQVNGSVSFQNAQGTGSNPNSHGGIVGAPIDGSTIFSPLYVFPLDFNKAVTGNFNLDYRFSSDEASPVLRSFGLSALMKFASGHPYTLGKGKGNSVGSLEGDPRFRTPIEPLNNSTTPWTYQLDIRLDKTVTLFDRIKANFYIFVINILDTRNIQNVFLRTGSAYDDGYLSDPTLGGTLHPAQRQDYENMYRAINLDYSQAFQNASGSQRFGGSQNSLGRQLFGSPRQIRVGVRLEY
ncbi:MAG TPA: TonB-dependent receptor [Ignavibacteria bacterium]|nr:TonB-dependent receptor [Ignavibacteria bacterium]